MELTPYVMSDGSWYRDMLTIEASKAVGQFAQEFHGFPHSNVRIPILTHFSFGLD